MKYKILWKVATEKLKFKGKFLSGQIKDQETKVNETKVSELIQFLKKIVMKPIFGVKTSLVLTE